MVLRNLVHRWPNATAYFVICAVMVGAMYAMVWWFTDQQRDDINEFARKACFAQRQPNSAAFRRNGIIEIIAREHPEVALEARRLKTPLPSIEQCNTPILK